MKRDWKIPIDFTKLGLLSLNPKDGACSPFLLEAHNEQWLWIKDFFFLISTEFMEENEAAIPTEQLCLHQIYKELSKQPPSCHYMELNSSVRLLKF